MSDEDLVDDSDDNLGSDEIIESAPESDNDNDQKDNQTDEQG